MTCARAISLGSAFLVATWLLLLAGCVTPPSPWEKAGLNHEKPPFLYEPLQVRNSCFVESVHFYDLYLQKHRGGDESWARVLEWGNEEGDFRISSGHAVTVFVTKGKLWYYDINYGMVSLDLPVDRRGDITDVAPKVCAKYPQYQPILTRYRDDFPQKPQGKIDFLFYHANPDVRDATRVASELGRVRPVKVFEFDLPVSPGAPKQTAAAVSFMFGRRLCLYFPRTGTWEAPRFVGSMDDLRLIGMVVKRLFPGASDIRWQPGGYLLFPDEKS